VTTASLKARHISLCLLPSQCTRQPSSATPLPLNSLPSLAKQQWQALSSDSITAKKVQLRSEQLHRTHEFRHLSNVNHCGSPWLNLPKEPAPSHTSVPTTAPSIFDVSNRKWVGEGELACLDEIGEDGAEAGLQRADTHQTTKCSIQSRHTHHLRTGRSGKREQKGEREVWVC
jgi:hypothetical protein